MPDFGPEYRKNRGAMASAPGRRRAARAWTLVRKAGLWGFVEDAAVRTVFSLAGLILAVLLGWGPAASAAEGLRRGTRERACQIQPAAALLRPI